MPIKTLHLTNAWHETSGGVATFYRALIQQANRRGHTLRLVVPGERDRVEDVGEYAKIYHVAAPASILNSSYRTIYPAQFLFQGSKVQTILSQERPDLIEVSDKYTLAYLGGLLRMKLLRDLDFRPVMIALSNERMDDNFRSYVGWMPFKKQFCSWYMRWIYFPFFDHHIANSQYTAQELRAAATGHKVTRGVWIRHMGVELSEFLPENRSEARRKQVLALCGASEEAKVLLYVGRLAPEKNLKLLFELMTHLIRTSFRQFHLIVAGDGMERETWEQYAAQKLPGQVVFLGHIRDQKMLGMLYANSDIFVHPNPHEPFGIAPLEAMASGLPLLAPNSGGVTSYATPENSWTVPPTVNDFAVAVEEIVSSPALVSRKTQNALAVTKAYSWEAVAGSFLGLYQDLHRKFQGEPAQLEADFYSTPGRPGTTRLAGWTSELAKSIFTKVATLREANSRTPKDKAPNPAPASTEQQFEPRP